MENVTIKKERNMSMNETADITEVLTEPDIEIEPATEDQPDNSSRGSKDFSPEERDTIIAMAKELGTAQVAREFGIKTKLISYWLHHDKRKASKHTTPKASKHHLDRNKEAAETEHKTVPAQAAESIKAIEPTKNKTVHAKLQEKSDEKQELTDKQALIIENAILRERISALNSEIEKLRAAIMSLM